MRGHHNRAPLRVEIAKDLPQCEPRLRIEADRGLVEEQHAWLVNERPRDHEALLLTARQLIDLRVRLLADAESVEQFMAPPGRGAEGHSEIRGVEFEVLDDGQAAVGIRPLRHDANPLPHAHVVARHVGARDTRFPRGGAHTSGEDADGRRLPRTVRAEKTEELALRNVEVERVEGYDRAPCGSWASLRERHWGRARPTPATRCGCGIFLPQRTRLDRRGHARKCTPRRASNPSSPGGRNEHMSTESPTVTARDVFVTGGTGYIGRRIIPALVARGHRVHALVRPASQLRLPLGCTPVVGDALDASTFSKQVVGCDTFLQLVGTPRPSPSKAAEFERVDFVSARESTRAANAAHVAHFVYVSVAQSTSVMRAYVDVRMRAEAMVREFTSNAPGRGATFVRPWYVLGPGHRWPYAFIPLYWLMEALPSTRERARQLGLVTIAQMVRALVRCVEQPTVGERVVTVPEIRRV